jgi:hypothetical protein
MKITAATRPNCYEIPSHAIGLHWWRTRGQHTAAGGRLVPKAPERPVEGRFLTPAPPPNSDLNSDMRKLVREPLERFIRRVGGQPPEPPQERP